MVFEGLTCSLSNQTLAQNLDSKKKKILKEIVTTERHCRKMQALFLWYLFLTIFFFLLKWVFRE